MYNRYDETLPTKTFDVLQLIDNMLGINRFNPEYIYMGHLWIPK